MFLKLLCISEDYFFIKKKTLLFFTIYCTSNHFNHVYVFAFFNQYTIGNIVNRFITIANRNIVNR